MEDNQQNQEQNQEQGQAMNEPQNPNIGFPLSQPKPKGKSNKWIFVILGIVIIIGGIIFFVTQSKKNTGEDLSPTPSTEALSTPVSEISPTPTATPADKGKIKIEIQNGTGITGEAAYLQGQLRSLGYKDLKAGNSETQDNVITQVTFDKNLDPQVADELKTKLEELYQEVNVKTSTTITTNVLIVTGLRKGATAKPSATPKASPTASASPSASPTATP